LPSGLPIRSDYDPSITVLSLLIAIASSALALWLVGQNELPVSRLICGAVLMGAGSLVCHIRHGCVAHDPRNPLHPVSFYPVCHHRDSRVGVALWIAFICAAIHLLSGRCVQAAAVVMGLAIFADALHRDGGSAVSAGAFAVLRMRE